MAYNENVQLEFSLDQKETYLASGLTKKAEEYTNLFRFKREALIIANEFGIENNTFYPDKYKILLEERGITYAERYKRYFLLKREIVRIKDFLGFNKELGDEAGGKPQRHLSSTGLRHVDAVAHADGDTDKDFQCHPHP